MAKTLKAIPPVIKGKGHHLVTLTFKLLKHYPDARFLISFWLSHRPVAWFPGALAAGKLIVEKMI